MTAKRWVSYIVSKSIGSTTHQAAASQAISAGSNRRISAKTRIDAVKRIRYRCRVVTGKASDEKVRSES